MYLCKKVQGLPYGLDGLSSYRSIVGLHFQTKYLSKNICLQSKNVNKHQKKKERQLKVQGLPYGKNLFLIMLMMASGPKIDCCPFKDIFIA